MGHKTKKKKGVKKKAVAPVKKQKVTKAPIKRKEALGFVGKRNAAALEKKTRKVHTAFVLVTDVEMKSGESPISLSVLAPGIEIFENKADALEEASTSHIICELTLKGLEKVTKKIIKY